MAKRQPSLRRDFRSPLLASRAAASQVSADASRDPRDAWSAPDSDREVVWTEPGYPRAHRRGPLPRRQRRPPKTKESFSLKSPKKSATRIVREPDHSRGASDEDS